jgi:ribosomal protein S18 acetylase RimI-like enzyme
MAHFETEFVVRLVGPEDAPILVPLIRALAEEEGATPPDPDDLEELLVALLTTGFSDFVVAERGPNEDEVVGCIQINYRLSTWAAAPYAYLEDFYLVPAARAQGIGTKLLDYACQRAEGRGCTSMQLDVREANKAAARLYARYGFKVSGSTIWKRSVEPACATEHQAEIEDLVRDLRDSAAQAPGA